MAEELPVAELGRQLSTAVVAFHEAVGAHLGVSAVDQRALAFIARQGPISAGAVARETRLTPGAVTGMVDRLERAGLVRREPDPADRRRVLITAVPGGTGQAADAFAELGAAMNAVLGRYDETELRVIEDYVLRTVEVLRQQTRKLSLGESGVRGG